MAVLTLTFDNGPEPDVTPGVLDILRERAHAEGHWIGNHTFTHSIPLGAMHEPDAPQAEIGRTQDVIGAMAHPDRLFRPFGSGGIISRALLSPVAVDHLVEGGYTCVLWNAIPRDWADPAGWVGRAIDLCERQDTTLMVLHDLPTGAMRHLPTFLDRIAERGIELRREFPPDLVPIHRGRVTRPLERFVSVEGS
jgi:peptidoglycan/xylan/chitin deacetylase (PgdA/CDA1 family)